MRIYADSADLSRVLPLLEDGLVAGVTSNPSILNRDGATSRDLDHLYRAFVSAGAEEVFMQATGDNRTKLSESAARIAGLGDRSIVKLPATADGFRVAAAHVNKDTRVLLTAVYSLAQATMAASIGVDYIAPYFGRIIDSGEDGLVKVNNMRTVLQATQTRVLVASVRSATAAATLALNGVEHITADVPVIEAMLLDPVTEASAVEFERISATW